MNAYLMSGALLQFCNARDKGREVRDPARYAFPEVSLWIIPLKFANFLTKLTVISTGSFTLPKINPESPGWALSGLEQ
jgi:hypothetical protein